jgi:spore maturation protein CgeB
MNIVFLGLSITSSWGNGHATTYRALLRELHRRGHRLLFLERDQPWYAAERDLPRPPYCEVQLYADPADLQTRFARRVAQADCVVVGSFVPDGIAVAEWATQIAGGLTAFYDIDTPVTLAAIAEDACEYLRPELIPAFDLYLSFTGGPTLNLLEQRYGARHAAAFYCSVDPAVYRPEVAPKKRWDLGYLGTFSTDRHAMMQRLLIEPCAADPALRGVVTGSLYPASLQWPENVERVDHLPPHEHPAFYNAQRFTLNLTRAAMVRAGYSPSVRLFEAAACGTPIISDAWEGLDTFFTPGDEILIASSGDDVLRFLRDISDEERDAIGRRARARILREHSAAHRAEQLESLIVAIGTEQKEVAA